MHGEHVSVSKPESANHIRTTALTILVVVSAFGLCGVLYESDTSSAETASGTIGNCTWSLSDEVLTIAPSMDVYPNDPNFGTMEISEMGTPWSEWEISIHEIVIEPGVTRIADWVFDGLTSVEKVTIPNTVKSIGAYSFHLCASLQSLYIPDSVTSIEKEAFSYCVDLKSISLPPTLTYIADDAFASCISLQKIDFRTSQLLGTNSDDSSTDYTSEMLGVFTAAIVILITVIPMATRYRMQDK